MTEDNGDLAKQHNLLGKNAEAVVKGMPRLC